MKNKLKFTVSGGKLLSAFMVGALSTVMATMAMAAPSAQPTLGDVNANFNNLTVEGILNSNRYIYNSSTATALKLIDSDGIWIDGPITNEGVLGGTPVEFNDHILVNGQSTLLGPLNISGIGGYITNFGDGFVVVDDAEGLDLKDSPLSSSTGSVVINDTLNVKNSISNSLGPVTINDNLEVVGEIVARTDSKGNPLPLDLSANLRNPATSGAGTNLPVRVEDDFIVAGQISTTGNIITSRGISAGLNITTSGGNIGSYQKRYKSVAVPQTTFGYTTLTVSCPYTQLTGCNGWISGANNNASYHGSKILYSSNTCEVKSYKPSTGTAGHTLYAEVMCFDPSGTAEGDINAN